MLVQCAQKALHAPLVLREKVEKHPGRVSEPAQKVDLRSVGKCERGFTRSELLKSCDQKLELVALLGCHPNAASVHPETLGVAPGLVSSETDRHHVSGPQPSDSERQSEHQ